MDMQDELPRSSDPIDQPMFWAPSQAFLKYAVASILVGCAAFVIALRIFAPDQTARAVGVVAFMLVAGAAWFFISRAKIRAAVLTLGIGAWAYVTAISTLFGGVNGSSVIIYPLIILFAGWLVGARAGEVVALLTVAATGGLLVAELLGLLPAPVPTPPGARWVIECAVFIVSAVLMGQLVRAYRNHLDEERKLGSDLALRSAELQAREAELTRAQAVAHVGSWVYDLATDTMRLSAETCRIFGLPQGTLGSHKSYLSRVHPEDRAAVDTAWQEALEGGKRFDNEHRILVGKAIRWVRQIAELEPGTEGALLRSVGITQDITERKRAREALQQSEQRLRAIVETEPECVKIVGRDGDLLEMNAAGLAMLEAESVAEARRHTLLGFLLPEYRAAFGDLHARVMGGESGTLEFEIIGLKGTQRWLETHAAPMRDAAGEVTMLLGITRDVTASKRAEAERAQLEAQLRESQKMEALGTLAGGVAHDFNNIMATIIGNVELARQDVGPGHAAQESLEEIRKASRRAKELVQQILAFGRRQVIERQIMSLAPVVEDSLRMLRSTLPAGVSLSMDCAPDAPTVLADVTQVQQVLLNLCANAWQAMQGQDRPATIAVSLTRYTANGATYTGPERRSRGGRVELHPGNYTCLMVRDTGPGMDQATRSRIFEPFFTTKPMGKGTGLGLAVVHGIVQDHGASIVVHSIPGEGATFRIYFPAVQASVPAFEAPAPAVAAPDLASAAAHGKCRHILYVDDDEAIVFLMTRLLDRQGYQVSGYTDAHAALEAARANPQAFELAVTDYNMPGMSGLELARALREIRPDLPVALASGYITEELRAKAPAAGVRELIYKPNTADELCAVLARLANALPD